MFSFFQKDKSYKKANFEDVQYALHNKRDFIIINTLSVSEQNCLILGTIDAYLEEKTINEMIYTIDMPDKPIILYGKNSNDDSPYIKYKQLNNLGIQTIQIYSGGLFEWLLLQDIYGNESFPTTTNIIDILKYK
jgi:hypothetical protein